MELTFSELDHPSTMNPYNQFNYNYWESDNTNSEDKQDLPREKRKKVSFKDGLSNVNLVVNSQGVLQRIVPALEQPNNQYQQPINPSIANEEPIDQSIKHSYIYNKYFKHYADPNINEPNVRVPKTMEEYHQMVREDQIKAYEQKKRIEEIKSTKLIFTTTPNASINPRNVVASKNNLRSMSFR